MCVFDNKIQLKYQGFVYWVEMVQIIAGFIRTANVRRPPLSAGDKLVYAFLAVSRRSAAIRLRIQYRRKKNIQSRIL